MDVVRYFLDTEFIANPDEKLELISVGIVDEYGGEYYAINNDCKFHLANDWVVKNVFPSFGMSLIYSDDGSPIEVLVPEEKNANFFKHAGKIQDEIIRFIGKDKHDFVDNKKVEVWVDYGAYDFVVLSQFFGGFEEMTKFLPEYFFDVQTVSRTLDTAFAFDFPICDRFPESLETPGNHNALLGAKSCKKRFEVIEEYL